MTDKEFTNNENFFLLLNKMKTENIDSYDNICLISNETLEEKYITLKCKHTFNYEHIFKEILNQKKNYNNYEITKLSNAQIKCPYCRNVSDGILPWKKTFPKIQFVNWPPNLSFVKNKCKYIFASGKKKGEMCCKFTDYTSQFCKNHEKIMNKRKSKEVKKLNKKLTLLNKTVKELKKICKENSIKKYSKLRKAELVELIKKNSKKTVIEHNKIITI